MVGTPEIRLHSPTSPSRSATGGFRAVTDYLTISACDTCRSVRRKSGNGALAPRRCPRRCRSDVQTQPCNLTTRRLPARQRRDPSDQGRFLPQRPDGVGERRIHKSAVTERRDMEKGAVRFRYFINSSGQELRSYLLLLSCSELAGSWRDFSPKQSALKPSTPALKHVLMLVFFIDWETVSQNESYLVLCLQRPADTVDFDFLTAAVVRFDGKWGLTTGLVDMSALFVTSQRGRIDLLDKNRLTIENVHFCLI